MSWGGLNNALTSWREGINQRFTGRSTRSDGGYADSQHASSSEHQADSDGTVDAFDMDNNLLGSIAPNGNGAERALLEALKLDFEADPRSYLWISHREISSRAIGPWRERAYDGSSPHDEHTHWQSVQAREDDGRAWAFPHTDALLRRMNGDDMEPKDLLDLDDVPNLYGDAATNKTVTVRTALKAAVSADVGVRDLGAAVTALRAAVQKQGLALAAIEAKLELLTKPPATK